MLLIQEEQVRRFDGSRNWRRKGWKTHERRLIQVVDQQLFETPQDMLVIIPDAVPEHFTTTNLAEATGQPLWLAQKMAYCLRMMGTITVVGKRGRGILYIRTAGCIP